MPYVLVLFREGPNLGRREKHAEAHADFVTSLIRRNLVLLGGDFRERVDGAQAAYLVRCGSFAEAQELVADDPYFSEGVFRPALVEWDLVGINPDAIDAGAIVTPRDVAEDPGGA